MSEINKTGHRKGWPKWVFILPVIDFVLLLKLLTHGKNIALFNPHGFIAHQQHSLMIFNVAVLMVIAIPTMFILYHTAWKYRESNPEAIHAPAANRSKKLVVGLWLIPTCVMLVLATVMWPATHWLAPREPIVPGAKTMTIQVVALPWKWLFIYPEQKIATVNFVQVPINTPVEFELTADDTPMSSFWIPNLGGQLYAMTGHINPLNLMATTPGDYPGSSAEINGAGFAGMRFTARASSSDDFNKWVQETKQSPDALSAEAYNKLLQPSESNPSATFSSYESNLYSTIVAKYLGPEGEGHNH